MSRLNLVVPLALAIAACTGTRLAQDGPPVEAQPLREGTTWTYQVSNGFNGRPLAQYRYRVASVNPQRAVIDVVRNGVPAVVQYGYGSLGVGSQPLGLPVAQGPSALPSLVVAAGWAQEERIGFSGTWQRYSPPLQVLPFPMAPGTKWSQAVTASEPPPAWPRRVEVWGEVLGWETVKVPAGEFRALKVGRASNLGEQEVWRGQTHMYEYDWYSPDLGLVVKHTEEGRYLVRGGDMAYWQEVDRYLVELTEHVPAR